MKRDMNDSDFAGLEVSLRHLRPASAPAAPQSLRQFIATVPNATPRTPLAARFAGSLSLHRAVFVAGVTAALVIALVVSSFVVNFRAAQTSVPGAGTGWHWQKADGTIVSRPLAVANGYIATCTQGAAPAASTDSLEQLQRVFNGQNGASLCTSSDGATWTIPADPRIANVPDGSAFKPNDLARLGDVSVVTSFSTDTSGNSVTDLWRSVDGVSWAKVEDQRLQNLMIASLGAIDGQFIGLAEDVATHTGWTVASPDGRTWSRVTQLPAEPMESSVSGGVMFLGSGGLDRVWTSRDGTTWQAAQMPAGIDFIAGVTRLSGGGYVAHGQIKDVPATRLLRSSDGATWVVDQGDLDGSILAVVVVGDRLVASVLEGVKPEEVTAAALPADLRLWQSLDGGRTWSRLNGPDGTQLAGQPLPMGDAVGVEVPDASNVPHLTLVGTPSALAQPVVPTSASQSAKPTGSSTPAILTLAPLETPDNSCASRPAWFPPVQETLLGSPGWYEVASYFGYKPESGSVGCDSSGIAGVGDEVAVIGVCDTPHSLDVRLSVSDSGGGTRQLAAFTVQCPIASSGPQVVWQLTDRTLSLRGMRMDIAAFGTDGLYQGNFAFLVESRGPGSSSPSATSMPTFAAFACPDTGPGSPASKPSTSGRLAAPSWLPVVPASDTSMGWTEVADGWGGPAFSCGVTYGPAKYALVVLVSCDAGQSFTAELRDLTANSKLGEYQVDCPRSPAEAAPVLLYAGASTGHLFGLTAATNVDGNWGYRIMTGPGSVWNDN